MSTRAATAAILVVLASVSFTQVRAAAALPALAGTQHIGSVEAGCAPQVGTCTFALVGNDRFEMEWVLMPTGRFIMGACQGDAAAETGERPAHSVDIGYRFKMGSCEVTQKQFKQFLRNTSYTGGNEASQMQPSDKAMNYASWYDAKAFCMWVTLCESNSGSMAAGYEWRLPTEAEWEYACRAGSTGVWCFGNEETKLGEYAWHFGNSGDEVHSVGKKKPNAFGLHDMHGNLWEWCEDEWYDNYLGAPSNGTARTSGDKDAARVMRGGSWFGFAAYCRSSTRFRSRVPRARNYFIGFRVVCAPRNVTVPAASAKEARKDERR